MCLRCGGAVTGVQACSRAVQGGRGSTPTPAHDDLTRSQIQLPPLMMFKTRHGLGTRAPLRRPAAQIATSSASRRNSSNTPPNAMTVAAHPEVRTPLLRVKRARQPRRVDAGTSRVTLWSSAAKIRSTVSRWFGTGRSRPTADAIQRQRFAAARLAAATRRASRT